MEHSRYMITGKGASYFPEILEKEMEGEQPYVGSAANGSVKLFVTEKYSFLQNSDKSLTVMTETTENDRCEVNAIVSGGKTSLLRLDLFFTEAGLLEDFEDFILQVSQAHNWEVKVFREQNE